MRPRLVTEAKRGEHRIYTKSPYEAGDQRVKDTLVRREKEAWHTREVEGHYTLSIFLLFHAHIHIHTHTYTLTLMTKALMKAAGSLSLYSKLTRQPPMRVAALLANVNCGKSNLVYTTPPVEVNHWCTPHHPQRSTTGVHYTTRRGQPLVYTTPLAEVNHWCTPHHP